MSQKLTEWTGESWEVITSDKSGSPTLRELNDTRRNEALEDAKQDSVVAEILDSFDGNVFTFPILKFNFVVILKSNY